MSEQNGKVCCNCRHNIRRDEDGHFRCFCDIDQMYLSYAEVMEGWCRHWAKEKVGDTDDNTKN